MISPKKILFTVCALLLAHTFTSTFTAKAEESSDTTEPQADILTKALDPGEVFSCSTDIFYHWKSTEKTVKENPPETPAPESTPVTHEEKKEFFTTLVERGKRGTQTKQFLERRLDQGKSEALEKCRTKHSAASCESKQLQAHASRFQLLDFEAKRTLQKSIMESCKESAGTCLSASSSDIICEVFSSPDTPLKVEPKKTEPTKKAEETKGKK